MSYVPHSHQAHKSLLHTLLFFIMLCFWNRNQNTNKANINLPSYNLLINSRFTGPDFQYTLLASANMFFQGNICTNRKHILSEHIKITKPTKI